MLQWIDAFANCLESCSPNVLSIQAFLEPSCSRLGVVASEVVTHSDILAMANAGKRAGASNFSRQEADMMLNSIEDELPIGSDEWKSVAEMHNAASGKNRTADSIKLEEVWQTEKKPGMY